jgi:hypothetical protein
MQICSFLPSATEILYALGMGESVSGVTFEANILVEYLAQNAILRIHSCLRMGASAAFTVVPVKCIMVRFQHIMSSVHDRATRC